MRGTHEGLLEQQLQEVRDERSRLAVRPQRRLVVVGTFHGRPAARSRGDRDARASTAHFDDHVKLVPLHNRSTLELKRECVTLHSLLWWCRALFELHERRHALRERQQLLALVSALNEGSDISHRMRLRSSDRNHLES